MRDFFASLKGILTADYGDERRWKIHKINVFNICVHLSCNEFNHRDHKEHKGVSFQYLRSSALQ